MIVYLQIIDSPEDRTKFEILYLAHRNIMYSAAYDILHNVQDAEDAVHHAFLKIAEHMDKIGDPQSPKTRGYVVTIAENRAIDMYRAKKAHPSVPYADAAMGIQVEYHGNNLLAGCILKLPARQRHIILLKYHHGYELKEIAKILGITYANALKIEQRAKVKLKDLCEEAGIEW